MTTLPGFDVQLPFTSGGCDAMEQAIQALVQVQEVCDVMFKNITQRVEETRNAFEGISERIDGAATRIEDLKGRKQGMVVFSRPKFPAHIKTAKPLLHVDDATILKMKPRRKHLVKPMMVQDDESSEEDDEDSEGEEAAARQAALAAKTITSLNARGEQVRHSRAGDPSDVFEFELLVPQSSSKKYLSRAEEGLGTFPRSMSSVSSLLLFNTPENLYRQYSDINVFTLSRAERVINDKKSIGKGAAIENDFMAKLRGEGYEFIPMTEDVADLLEDLPEDLAFEDIAQLDWAGHDVGDTDHIAPSKGGSRMHGGVDLPSLSEAHGIRPSKPLAVRGGPPALAIGGPSPPGFSGGPPAPPPPPGINPAGKGPPPPPGHGGKAPPPPPPPKGFPGGGVPPPPPPGGKKAPPPPPSGGPPGPPPPPPGGKIMKGPPGAPPPPPPPPKKGVAPPPKAAPAAPALKPAGKSDTKKNMNPLENQLKLRRRAMEGQHSDDSDFDEPAAKPAPKAIAPAPKGAPPPPKSAPPPPKSAPPPPPPKAGGLPPRHAQEDDDDW